MLLVLSLFKERFKFCGRYGSAITGRRPWFCGAWMTHFKNRDPVWKEQRSVRISLAKRISLPPAFQMTEWDAVTCQDKLSLVVHEFHDRQYILRHLKVLLLAVVHRQGQPVRYTAWGLWRVWLACGFCGVNRAIHLLHVTIERWNCGSRVLSIYELWTPKDLRATVLPMRYLGVRHSGNQTRLH